MIHKHHVAANPAVVLFAAALVVMSLCNGCTPGLQPSGAVTGSTTTGSTPTGTVTTSAHLQLLPEALTIRQDESWNFTATMATDGTLESVTQTSMPVSWSVLEGAAGGSITSNGVYTAPSTPGTYHVVANQTGNSAAVATSVVIVGQGLTLSGDTFATRGASSATLLENGHVLITGGAEFYWQTLQASLALNRAELYDPATGVFKFATTIPSDGATATLLPSGDVLFLGGATSTTYPSADLNPIGAILTAKAEIYKTATGTIQDAGSLSMARSGHTATLLPNGKILVTGGGIQDPIPANAGYTIPTATAELYDPTSGTSTLAGSMSVALENHQAILLQNGKVLILGPASAQIYDPSANAMSPVSGSGLVSNGNVYDVVDGAAALTSGGGFTATLLLDGRVLITGGAVADLPYYGDLAVDTAEIYDPATGQITQTGSKMTVPRYLQTATLMPNGTVLIAGGETVPVPGDSDPMDSFPTDTTEIFDPSTNTFTPGHPMQTPREGETATLLPDGTVFLIGGSFGIPSISTEIFR
jgi:hypothetical protein